MNNEKERIGKQDVVAFLGNCKVTGEALFISIVLWLSVLLSAGVMGMVDLNAMKALCSIDVKIKQTSAWIASAGPKYLCITPSSIGSTWTSLGTHFIMGVIPPWKHDIYRIKRWYAFFYYPCRISYMLSNNSLVEYSDLSFYVLQVNWNRNYCRAKEWSLY